MACAGVGFGEGEVQGHAGESGWLGTLSHVDSRMSFPLVAHSYEGGGTCSQSILCFFV